MKKKALSLLLCVAMMASLVAVPVMAVEPEPTKAPISEGTFTDTANHWCAEAIHRWAQYGIINGVGDGKFDPEGTLTRGALAIILSNLLGLTVKAENTYADVENGAWYADAVLKCTAAGIMKGNGANANPRANVSRQEAMVLLARALGMKPAKTVDLAAYQDAAQVPDWAAGYVTTMTKAGIVSGVGGGLIAPRGNMTRAAVMKILDKSISDYVNKAGTYEKIVGTGIVLVTVPDVILKGNTIAGSLLVAEGVGNGSCTLDNTKIVGETTIRGGGVNSFVVKGGSVLGTVNISRVDGAVRIVTSDGSTIETTYIDDGKDDVIMEGTFGDVSVAGDVPVMLKGADVKSITATGKGVDITVDKNSKVTTVATKGENTKLTVAGTVTNVAATKEATGMNLSVSKGGIATNVTTAAAGSSVTNEGKVGTIAMAKGADTKYVAGEGTKLPAITAADKKDLSTSTVAAEAAKAATAKAEADKLAADKLTADATTDAEKAAAKAAADKAAADQVAAEKASEIAKKEEDEVRADADKNVSEKPVTPPVIGDGGAVTVPDPIPVVPDKPKPDGGGGNPPAPDYVAIAKGKLHNAVVAAVPTVNTTLTGIATLSLNGNVATVDITEGTVWAATVFEKDFLAPLFEYAEVYKVKIGAQTEILIDRTSDTTKKAAVRQIMADVAREADLTNPSSTTPISVLHGKIVSVVMYGKTPGNVEYSDTYTAAFVDLKTKLMEAITAAVEPTNTVLNGVATLSLTAEKAVEVKLLLPETSAIAVFGTNFLAKFFEYGEIQSVTISDEIGAHATTVDNIATGDEGTYRTIMAAVAVAAKIQNASGTTPVSVLSSKTVKVVMNGTSAGGAIYSDTFTINFTTAQG